MEYQQHLAMQQQPTSAAHVEEPEDTGEKTDEDKPKTGNCCVTLSMSICTLALGRSCVCLIASAGPGDPIASACRFPNRCKSDGHHRCEVYTHGGCTDTCKTFHREVSHSSSHYEQHCHGEFHECHHH